MTLSHLEKTRPEACQCEPGEWLIEYEPVCEHYRPVAADDNRCFTCQHDIACHPKSELAKQLFSIGETYARLVRGDFNG